MQMKVNIGQTDDGPDEQVGAGSTRHLVWENNKQQQGLK